MCWNDPSSETTNDIVAVSYAILPKLSKNLAFSSSSMEIFHLLSPEPHYGSRAAQPFF